MTSVSIDAKAALRRHARARRAAAHAAASGTAPSEMARQLLRAVECGNGPVVAGYTAIRDEIDPLPALAAMATAGCTTALPVVDGEAQPLVFRRWSLGDPLVPDGFSVPAPLRENPEIDPDVLLVPMLAFDREGRRMGYGAGFYDRTLQALRRRRPVIAIGLAYADQEVDRVPTDAYDEPLDWVVTERFAIRCAPTVDQP
ncbi:5-formyltetrahydrofolate cyclo-ligase [Fodinicurvata sp. EGI_FJ10296]|uniref:5-formyltetrahydrofolate cyclo-ligase n=1 Tax=Fodinicurvata sp. EGI_FJ10296 TaxID=3231908 RepID=UPI003456164A